MCGVEPRINCATHEQAACAETVSSLSLSPQLRTIDEYSHQRLVLSIVKGRERPRENHCSACGTAGGGSALRPPRTPSLRSCAGCVSLRYDAEVPHKRGEGLSAFAHRGYPGCSRDRGCRARAIIPQCVAGMGQTYRLCLAVVHFPTSRTVLDSGKPGHSHYINTAGDPPFLPILSLLFPSVLERVPHSLASARPFFLKRSSVQVSAMANRNYLLCRPQ